MKFLFCFFALIGTAQAAPKPMTALPNGTWQGILTQKDPDGTIRKVRSLWMIRDSKTVVFKLGHLIGTIAMTFNPDGTCDDGWDSHGTCFDNEMNLTRVDERDDVVVRRDVAKYTILGDQVVVHLATTMFPQGEGPGAKTELYVQDAVLTKIQN